MLTTCFHHANAIEFQNQAGFRHDKQRCFGFLHWCVNVCRNQNLHFKTPLQYLLMFSFALMYKVWKICRHLISFISPLVIFLIYFVFLDLFGIQRSPAPSSGGRVGGPWWQRRRPAGCRDAAPAGPPNQNRSVLEPRQQPGSQVRPLRLCGHTHMWSWELWAKNDEAALQRAAARGLPIWMALIIPFQRCDQTWLPWNRLNPNSN